MGHSEVSAVGPQLSRKPVRLLLSRECLDLRGQWNAGVLEELKNSPMPIPALKEEFDFSHALKTRFNMSNVWQTAIVRSIIHSPFHNGRDCCFDQDISTYSFACND